jgi:hypothetical protein
MDGYIILQNMNNLSSLYLPSLQKGLDRAEYGGRIESAYILQHF